MNLRSFFNHVKKTVYVKIFALSKLRNCLTEHAAILSYKLTILPYLEYAGFMLISCSVTASYTITVFNVQEDITMHNTFPINTIIIAYLFYVIFVLLEDQGLPEEVF